MKKVIATIITIISFVLVMLLIVLPKNKFSPNENRYLNTFPDITIKNIISGKFQSKFSDFVADHFPFREKLLSLKTNTEHKLGNYRINGIYYGKDNYLIEEYNKPQNTDRIIRIINRFQETNNNKNISFMLVPTSVSIYSDKLPSNNLNYSEDNTIDYYKDNLNVNFLDIRKKLLNNKDKYLFFRTDHHWTTFGSYYAYEDYCSKNNLKIYPTKYKLVSKDFQGTIYSKLLDNSIKKDYIYKVEDDTKYLTYIDDKKVNSFYDESFLSKKDKYSYFFGGNKSLIHITNEKEKDSLLIIKDSYANSFIPLISRNYHDIYVIDPRYYKESINTFIEDNNISNILFLYNVLTIDDDIGILSINR